MEKIYVNDKVTGLDKLGKVEKGDKIKLFCIKPADGFKFDEEKGIVKVSEPKPVLV